MIAVTAASLCGNQRRVPSGNVNGLKAINGRCMAAPASTCCLNASSITHRDRDQKTRQSPSRWQATRITIFVKEHPAGPSAH
jgi:hypothetical protein